MPASKKIYSIGMFGLPNFGDELLCKVLFHQLSEFTPSENITVSAFSRNILADYTRINRKNIIQGLFPTRKYFLNVFTHVQTVRKADLITVGGGGLIVDEHTWRSIPRYVFDLLWAILLDKPFIFIGLGVRPLKRQWLKNLTRFVLNRASCIYCRDAISVERMYSYLGQEAQAPVICGPDLANLMRPLLPEAGERKKEDPYLIVNLRETPKIADEKLDEMFAALKKDFPDHKVVFLVAENTDIPYYEEIISRHKEKFDISIFEPQSLEDAFSCLMNADGIIGERLHVNVTCVYANLPLSPIVYEDKVESFLNMACPDLEYCHIESVGIEVVNNLKKARQNGIRLNHDLETQAAETLREAVDFGLNKGRAYSFLDKLKAFGWIVRLLLTAVAFYLQKISKKLSGTR